MQQNVAHIPNIGSMYNKSPQNVVNNSPQNQINDLHIVNTDNGVQLTDIPSVLQQVPNPNAPQKPPIDNNITDIDKQNQIIGLVERWGQVLNSTQIPQGLTEKLLLGPTSTNHLSTLFKLNFSGINETLTDGEKLNDKEIEYIKEKLQSLDAPTGQPKVDLNKGEVPLWAIEQLGADLIKEGKIKESNFLLKAYENNIKLNADKDKTIAYVKSFIGYGLTIAGIVALFVGGTWTLGLTLIGVGFSVMAVIGIFQKLHDRSKTKDEKNLADGLKETLDTLKNNAGKSKNTIQQTLQKKIDESKILKEQNQKLQQDNKTALKEKDDKHKEEIDKLNKDNKKKVEDIAKEKDKLTEELDKIKEKMEQEQQKFEEEKKTINDENTDAKNKLEEEHNDKMKKLRDKYNKTLNDYEKFLNEDIEHHKKIDELFNQHKIGATPITSDDNKTWNQITGNQDADYKKKFQILSKAVDEMNQHYNYSTIKNKNENNLNTIAKAKQELQQPS